MAMLDEPTNVIDYSTVTARPTGIRWGLIAGIAGVVLFLLFSMTGIIDKSGKANWIGNLINLGLWIGICMMAIKKHRDEELGGYITLGRCVSLGMWIGFVGGIIGGLFTVIYMKFINPTMMRDAMDLAKEQMIEKGQSEEMADKAIGMMSFMTNPAMIFVFAIVGSFVVFLLCSLVVGLFMRKERPFPV